MSFERDKSAYIVISYFGEKYASVPTHTRIDFAHLIPPTLATEVLALDGDIQSECKNEEGDEEGAAPNWRVKILVDEPFTEARDALICVLIPFAHMWDGRLDHVQVESH